MCLIRLCKINFKESPQTVLEARQAENVKRGLHREFGGKCPKDLHADCKETIMQLEAKIKSLEEELSSLKKGYLVTNEITTFTSKKLN